MKRSSTERLIGRRDATRTLLFLLGGTAVAVACGDGESGTNTDGSSKATTDPEVDDVDTTDGDWASGGTKAMTAKASYPDPFATSAAACLLLSSVTEGPCTEAADQVREDISEGYTGLPMRLALRVVDSECNPLAGAEVKVWHTQLNGSYSGDTPNNQMCLKDASDASKHYFRGAQTTDDDGRVYFDSCFPGWYRGRTVHIHFTVSLDGRSFTSQLVFDQALVASIFDRHPEYASFGQPDTTNAADNVVGNGDLERFTLTTAKMSDGAMLASKEIVFA